MSDWVEYKICDIGEVIGGGTPKTKVAEYWNGSIHWLTPKDLSNYKYRYISSGDRNISEKGLKNSSARLLPEGTVLLTSRAPIGYIAIAQNEITTNQGFRSIVLNDGFCSEFVYYLLSANTDYLKSHASGTTFQELSGSSLKNLSFVFPPHPEQKVIAHILGTLDDKIELNQKMNETLEAIARAIFKSWFVDFDPVRAKAEGRQPEGMDAETASLFPDSFEDSELGMIPRGWKAGKLGDDFDIVMGQSPPGTTYNEEENGLPFYQGNRDFGFRYPTRRVYCSAPKRMAKKGDTLVSVRAPVGAINMAAENCCIGRGVAAVRHKSGSRSYTSYSLRHLQEKFGVYESEGTVFGSINKKDFNDLTFILTDPTIIERFEKLAFPFDESVESNSKEILTLIKIRDVLLPKLMSGEIKIKDVASIQGEIL